MIDRDKRERNRSGRYAMSVTHEEVLDLFEEVRGPVIGSPDIAEHFDVTTQTARNRLTELKDRGLVDSRRIGQATVWWRVNEQSGTTSGSGNNGERDK